MKKITCSFIKDKKLLGFTLAEVLITLTIIGVVAALTIPSLLANVNDKTYDSKRKGFITRFAQAISQMDQLNSYGTDAETSAENLLSDGLSKVYKLTNICNKNNLSACDIPNQANTKGGVSKDLTIYKKYSDLTPYINAHILGGIDTDVAGFRTKNGESALVFYNPNCVPEQTLDSNNEKYFIKEICMYMIYDLDGAKKGPNMLSSDMGIMIVLYPDTPYVTALDAIYFLHHGMVAPSYGTGTTASSACRGSRYGNNRYTLASREEAYMALMSLRLIRGYQDTDEDGEPVDPPSDWYWTSTVEGSGPNDYAWQVSYILKAKKALRSENSHPLCNATGK